MTSTTLQDQAVVVLGGTAGIGQAVARAAAAAGARVTVLGRSAKTDGGIHGIAVDANDTASLGSALVQAAAGGKIDHLVITIGSARARRRLPRCNAPIWSRASAPSCLPR